MQKLDNTTEHAGLKGKNLSLPVGKSNLKGDSNMSSTLTAASSVSMSMYAEPAERLDWSVPYLTDKHVKMYETCNKYKSEHTQAHFDFIASNYEGMYTRMGYPDPQYVANCVAKMAKRNKPSAADAKVIDFACGTGLVGKYLSA